jgi:hypothetical protein
MKIKNKRYFSERARNLINQLAESFDFSYREDKEESAGFWQTLPDCIKYIWTVKKYHTISKQDRMLKHLLWVAFDYLITDKDIRTDYILKQIKNDCETVKYLYHDGTDFLIKDLGGTILVSNKYAHVFKKVCRIDFHVSFYLESKEE